MTLEEYEMRLNALERSMRLMKTAGGILSRFEFPAQAAHIDELLASFHVEHRLLTENWFDDYSVSKEAEVRHFKRVGIFKDGM